MTMLKTETSPANAGRGAALMGEGEQFRLVLATDLDGTFLGGTETERRTLYEAISSRADVLLIFVTGRDVDFIRELIAKQFRRQLFSVLRMVDEQALQ